MLSNWFLSSFLRWKSSKISNIITLLLTLWSKIFCCCYHIFKPLQLCLRKEPPSRQQLKSEAPCKTDSPVGKSQNSQKKFLCIYFSFQHQPRLANPANSAKIQVAKIRRSICHTRSIKKGLLILVTTQFLCVSEISLWHCYTVMVSSHAPRPLQAI